MAAVLASLAPTASSRVYAQVMVYYYNPYGQGPYGAYGQGYAAPYQANGSLFPSHGGMFSARDSGYSGYGNVPYGYGNRFDYGIGRFDYGIGPPVRVYGRSSYYQPSYGRVYVPFGYY